jgi:hypothetical protein
MSSIARIATDAYTAYADAPLDLTAAAGFKLVAKDFDVRIEPLEALKGPPDFVTVFPGGVEGYVAAHDEAIAYLEDVIADCLETLKDLRDRRFMNAMDLPTGR